MVRRREAPSRTMRPRTSLHPSRRAFRAPQNEDRKIKQGKPHDRILLRLFQPLDLSRLSQHPAAGKRARRRDRMAADPGRRHLQYRQSERLCPARDAGAAEGALHEEGSRRLDAVRGACDQDAADGVSGEQRQGDARLYLAWSGHGAVRDRGVRDLLGRRQGHLAGLGADGGLQEGWRRSRQILRRHRPAGDQGPAQGQYGRGDGARRFWFTDHLCRQDRYVFRQRPDAADPRSAGAPESAGRLMPKAVVCRELGPPESLRLETFDAAPLASGQVRVAIRAAGINFPDILMAAGEYQLKPPLPFTPGVEAAGDVVEVNETKGIAIGNRVIVKMRHGAYCDEAVTTPAQLVKLPSNFDYAEGATFLAGHGTAYH